MVESTEEEMQEIADALREFYRDCDQFVKDTNDAEVDLLDLETAPEVDRFYGPASYRQSKWDGPYIQDKYDDNGYTRDAWQTPYRYDYTEGNTSCTLTSCGPDRTCGNSDDIEITISAQDIVQEKVRKVKEELAYINAKKEELKSRYQNAGRTWPPTGFDIDDLFNTYGCDTTGLVAWWKMDEDSWNGTSGEVTDSQGSNDGTAYGGATTVASGKLARCGYFDGSDDYVEVANSSSISPNEQITVEAWVYLNGGSQTMVRKNPNDYLFEWGTAGTNDAGTNPQWYIATASGTYYIYGSDSYASLNINQWYHVVGTYNSETGAKMYINGREATVTIANSDLGAIQTSNSYLRIGNSGSEIFKGYIDEVRIWNRALTSDDVFLEYLRGVYLVDWAYRYDEWENEYAWDSTNDEFYSYGPDRTQGTSDDIYQTE